MSMTLGDGFNARKKLASEIEQWSNRLAQAGFDRREFMTKSIDGDGAFDPEPGSLKTSERHYTIEECRSRLDELIKEERKLAMRISLTNQVAKGTIIDIDGQEKDLTIPELLVLRNEIIPKMEMIVRNIPVRSQGVNIIDSADEYQVSRVIQKREKKKETLTEKGHKVEEVEIIGYRVVDTTEYGVSQRLSWDEIDRIQEFAASVKQAINQANKTELVEAS